MSSDTGKWIIIIGIVLVVTGIVLYFFHDKLGWVGRLPGDIHVEKKNFRFYFPITTLIIINVVILIIAYIIRKFNS